MGAGTRAARACHALIIFIIRFAAAHGAAAASGSVLLDPQQAQPVWAQQHSQDIQLNFSTADPEFEEFKRAEGEVVFKHYKSRRVKVRAHSGWHYGNTALVRYGSEFVMAVRRMSIFRTNQSAVALEDKYQPMPNDLIVDWWASTVLLCSVHSTHLTPLACKPYDPRPWRECLWNGVFEGSGIEDPRLVVWPGKGLFMMFGSKPPAVEQEGDLTPWRLRCGGRVVFQQYMVRLHPPPGSGGESEDAWGRGVVALDFVEQHVHMRQHRRSTNGDGNADASKESSTGGRSKEDGSRGSSDTSSAGHKGGKTTISGESSDASSSGSDDSSGSSDQGPGDVKEKNWNPFIYKGRLLFSHSFVPHHVVLQPLANGTCTQRFATPNPVMARAFAGQRPRGNTQAILVPSALSGEPRSYFLGIVHVETNRSYSNHFYKMQPAPPFHILAVSGPVPVQGRQHVAVRGWGDVSFPMSLDLISETGVVVIGYGSGDNEAHVKLMPLRDVQALFGADTAAQTAVREASAATKPVPPNKAGKAKGKSGGSSVWKPWPPGSSAGGKSRKDGHQSAKSILSKMGSRKKQSSSSAGGKREKQASSRSSGEPLESVDEDERSDAGGGQHHGGHNAADALLDAAPAGAVGSLAGGSSAGKPNQ